MGIDQLGFQSVQLGYLKILQMGNADPNNTEAGKEYKVKPHPHTRQAKGYAVQICTMLKNVLDLELGDSKEFPHLKILTAKTVNKYIAINNKIAVEDVEDEPRVKKTPMKKVVSKKRPAAAVVEPAVKRKRKLFGKAADVAKDSALVTVAQDAVPLQIVAPIFDVPPAPKRKAPKRKLRLEPVSDDESIEKEQSVGTIVEKERETSVDDVDSIIGQVLADTTQLETDMGAPGVIVVEEPVGSQAADITIGDNERLIGTEGEKSQGTETEVVATTDEESMSIEEHLAQIPDNMFLPSVKAADVTQIWYGQGIGIREVDLYKASLPQIDDSDKGKESLVEDSIQGHPAREIFSLICADIDFLVQLREQVIEDVVKFVNSFSFRRLATLQSEELYTKEERHNFVSGTPTTTIDLKVLELLTVAYHFALKVLLRQVQEHKLEWTRPSNSLLFEGNNIVRSYFIPRNHRTIFSRSVHDRWAEVCVGVVQFSLIGSLSSAHTINRCRDIVGPLIDIEEISIGFRGLFQRGLNTNSFAIFLDVFVEQPEGQVLSEDESSSDVSIVYRSPSLDAEPSVQTSPVVDIISVPTESACLTPRNSDISLPSPHQSSSSASSMNFSYEILQDDDTAVKQILESSSADVASQTSLPAAPTTDVAESFTELQASLSRIFINHEKASRRLGDSQSEILFKIDHLEKTFFDALTQQDLAFRSLIKSVRQEAQNQADITSIELKSFRAQNVFLMIDLADTRKEVQELKAAFSNDILDFCAQAQENYNNLTTQLSELVDYINQGGNDKNGESSSRGPQPPPDDGDRSGSGGSDGRNRGGRSESSRKRYFSSGGGPQRRSAEYWFGGT
ncbi:hypothetical protein F511_21301 [Dorcoceras hygrometricum]|uniref:Uncharacterized protein n=1 Tax=Dorcoceras hygrometricum TaxID=472368 RepID=A0A2Z7BT61_9LAMI|nr:hypothetical protein F511_21301 [Dorcoceras hygrometricum]